MSARAGSVWTAQAEARLRAHHASGLSYRSIATVMGLTVGQISGRMRLLNLHFRIRESAVPLRSDHPAAVDARTIFPATVADPGDTWKVLKPGRESFKLGAIVEKGAWRGFPIFSLTLEERATCPRSCAQWLWCYGNTSAYRTRIAHGADLEAALHAELSELDRAARRRHRGFAVRLHMLGDFYSAAYVDLWRAWLDRSPTLHVFGYTAWPLGSEIGDAVHDLAHTSWRRFAIRQSASEPGAHRTIVVRDAAEAEAAGAIVCPAQTGATRCCGTCGLCWAPAARDKTIAFLRHGMSRGKARA